MKARTSDMSREAAAIVTMEKKADCTRLCLHWECMIAAVPSPREGAPPRRGETHSPP